MPVAATVFSYFRVQSPEVLAADNELSPAVVPEIHETQAGEPAEPGTPSPLVN